MNRLCELLQIGVPIIQGGMGNISHPQLTAAISNAGALGTIGAGTMSPDEVEAKIIRTKELTVRPFALNIAITVSPYTKELIELVLKHEVPVISLSAGNPASYVEYLHHHSVKVIAVVGAVKHAKKAEAGGADVIVGEGYEAAGINSPLETTTLALIPQLVDAVHVPVVAAGGIADGRGMAASFALGAEGVQMGTRFIATKEAPFSDIYKQRLIDANDNETVVIGRSVKRIRRVLKNPYVKEILESETAGMTLDTFNELTNEDHHILGAVEGNEESGYWNSGQISGLIRQVPSVGELIANMVNEMNLVVNKLQTYKANSIK
ncbi:nitronate monooxygenase [Peribacillus cavernae]|uniref:Probable nitronate monooxygenase n=1 Tax=Peribacillus cavernae TaxID=1674310 RepID=A0A3S1B943_9BACI|nr:nitronate monooxygenase [Peribacillus cavernae]MDQ0218728.1 enoyl-[acyl-carrier protein] reductase II [Peribacillus cavernae]RUQ30942.1 nitronate monooxygenase [Peribacillus cavernae]